MLEHNRLISKRLKGLILLLLLASFAPVIQAEEDSSNTPLIIENVPDSTTDATPAVKAPETAPQTTPQATSQAAPQTTAAATAEESVADSDETSTAFADAITKAETFLLDSPSSPQAVKTFVEKHSDQIEWTKDHPLHINAFALVFAILGRMCCSSKPSLPKPRVPQPIKAPKQKKTAPSKKLDEPVQPAQPVAPATAATAPEPEKNVNPFQKVLDETLKSPVTPARDTFVIQTFLRWSAAEPQSSYQWAIGLGDPVLSRRLLTDALLAEEEKDSVAAFDLALSALPAEHQDPVIDAIVRQWTRKQPQAAADKIVSLPSGTPVLQTTIAALVETWTDVDIEAAHHWLVALPVNLFRDLALSVFIQRLAIGSPEAAAAWVESISNDQVRQQVAGMVAQKWQAVDPEAANAWTEKALA
jgi:hypothetical protein